jgi:lysylphosphatidylglycerol synthetase-like protein (DUF2156 family)
MSFELYYSVFYLCFLILTFCYKLYGGLKYPPRTWELEFSAAIIFSFMQFQRLDLGFRANRNEHSVAMCIYTIFTAIAIGFYVYFFRYQTYVLLIDLVVGVIGVFFAVFELALGVAATAKFYKIKSVF